MKNRSDILYFDYAATTPCAPEVAEAIHSSLVDNKTSANASSAHSLGYSANLSIQETRNLVGKLINGDPSNIIFTSGATESNNFALIGLSDYLKDNQKSHIVSSSTEHKAILDSLKHLSTLGHTVTLVDPDKQGNTSIRDIEKAITPETGLISIMHVNNETGVIQDIASIGKIAKDKKITFHVDAAQSAGKIPIDVSGMNIDLLSLSAHKFYGPKGIGALYIQHSLRQNLSPLLHGGGQEESLRPGTYANHQIIGLGKSIKLALDNMQTDIVHAQKIREVFLQELNEIILSINGNEEQALPNILNISIDGVDATTLTTSLQDKVALATGSACNSGTVLASHVLTAMGLIDDSLNNAIRISFGRYTTIKQAIQASEIIKADVERIKNIY